MLPIAIACANRFVTQTLHITTVAIVAKFSSKRGTQGEPEIYDMLQC